MNKNTDTTNNSFKGDPYKRDYDYTKKQTPVTKEQKFKEWDRRIFKEIKG